MPAVTKQRVRYCNSGNVQRSECWRVSRHDIYRNCIDISTAARHCCSIVPGASIRVRTVAPQVPTDRESPDGADNSEHRAATVPCTRWLPDITSVFRRPLSTPLPAAHCAVTDSAGRPPPAPEYSNSLQKLERDVGTP